MPDQLTMLSSPPDWQTLEPYQHSMTKEEFLHLLNTQYVPTREHTSWLKIHERYVDILSHNQKYYRLHFQKPTPRAESKLPSLKDMHICIDPGHIGGDFSQIEFRHFQIPGHRTIKEGDISLIIAKKLQQELASLGTKVSLSRTQNKPVTLKRPKDFEREALQFYMRRKNIHTPPSKPYSNELSQELESLKNLLFYRISDIHSRAKLINHTLKPDLVLSIHLNASPWSKGDLQLLDRNHVHFLVNGTYLPSEVYYQDVRFHLIHKLLSRSAYLENTTAQALSLSFATHTQLPPFTYKGTYATNINNNPYVWARNLIVNRLIHCPVVLLEPYVTNEKKTHARLQEALQGNNDSSSIFEEYTRSVLEALIKQFP